MDAEYKLKSETQTPSGHLGHSTDTELTNKSTDDRGMIYQNKVSKLKGGEKIRYFLEEGTSG